MSFMDVVNFDVRAAKKSCVHIVQPDGKLIPFETCNIFYRGDQSKLNEVRHKIASYYNLNVDSD